MRVDGREMGWTAYLYCGVLGGAKRWKKGQESMAGRRLCWDGSERRYIALYLNF